MQTKDSICRNERCTRDVSTLALTCLLLGAVIAGPVSSTHMCHHSQSTVKSNKRMSLDTHKQVVTLGRVQQGNQKSSGTRQCVSTHTSDPHKQVVTLGQVQQIYVSHCHHFPVRACVCVRERKIKTERDKASERERGGEREREIQRGDGGESGRTSLCVLCMCVREREREKERGGEGERGRERERQSERTKETEGRARTSEREEHLQYLTG